MSDRYGPGYGPGSGYGPGPGYGQNQGYGQGGATDRYAAPPGGPPTVSAPGYGGPVDGYPGGDPAAFGKPPVAWLAVAAVAGVAAAAVALVLGATITFAVVAWVVAGPIAIGLLAVYAHRDTMQRARPVYDARPQAAVAYWATAVVAMAAILISAWRIAQWVGRL